MRIRWCSYLDLLFLFQIVMVPYIAFGAIMNLNDDLRWYHQLCARFPLCVQLRIVPSKSEFRPVSTRGYDLTLSNVLIAAIPSGCFGSFP